MRLIDYVQIAFYLILALLAILVAAQAIATMRGISDDLRLSQVTHQQMLKDHQEQMRLLQR